MKIALSTDHAGLELLTRLEEFLTAQGHECVNFGPKSFDPDDDYPDFIFPAAHAVAGGECEAGIIMGGSGQGEAMAANRVKGVRCALFYGPVAPKSAINAEGDKSDDPYEILRLTRRHNHSNMLSFAARFISWDEMKEAVSVYLGTSGDDGAERHIRRVKKLDQ